MCCGSVGLPGDLIRRNSFPWGRWGGNARAQSCRRRDAAGGERTRTREEEVQEARWLLRGGDPDLRPDAATRRELAMNETTPVKEKQAREVQARAADRAESDPVQQPGTHTLGTVVGAAGGAVTGALASQPTGNPYRRRRWG